jgi:asparagine synthase (glutamine-hydrolysing)
LLGDNTYFKNIKLVRPATILEYNISDSVIVEKYYWTFGEIKPLDISYEAAVDKLHELVEHAVLCRIKAFNVNKIVLPLSGGLDSRLIFAILDSHGMMPRYIFTNGTPTCTDVKYAKRLCRKFGYKHWTHEPIRSAQYLDEAQTHSFINEGMCFFFEFETYKFPSNTILVSGYVGDMVFGGSFKEDPAFLDSRMDASIAELLYGQFSYLSEYNDEYFNINKIEPSLFINRVRRYTAQMVNVGLNECEYLLPYVDNEIIDFIYALPDRYRANNHLYADMLLKFYPKYFKKIPWNRNNRPIQGRIYRNNQFNLNWWIEKIGQCSFLSSKHKKSILKRINYNEWFAEKTFHIYEEELLRQENYAKIIDIYDKAVIKQYFTKNAWVEIGEAIRKKHVWKMALFLTAEFYFRNLIDRRILDKR